MARVAERVRKGGHDVPEAVIRRRYVLGLENLITLYQPFLDSWQVLDNADLGGPRTIMAGGARARKLRELRALVSVGRG